MEYTEYCCIFNRPVALHYWLNRASLNWGQQYSNSDQWDVFSRIWTIRLQDEVHVIQKWE